MGCIGNFLWFIFCGFWQGLGWMIIGVLWCVTIVGIPVGVQCFKFAKMSFFPFGKEVEYSDSGASIVLNIFWLLFGGILIALAASVNGLILCVTIVGIPFGMQCFKMAKLALMPFGAQIIEKRIDDRRIRG